MTQETAEKYGLKNISDLSKVADQLTLYGSPSAASGWTACSASSRSTG